MPEGNVPSDRYDHIHVIQRSLEADVHLEKAIQGISLLQPVLHALMPSRSGIS
jgi:hypothetical protein